MRREPDGRPYTDHDEEQDDDDDDDDAKGKKRLGLKGLGNLSKETGTRNFVFFGWMKSVSGHEFLHHHLFTCLQVLLTQE